MRLRRRRSDFTLPDDIGKAGLWLRYKKNGSDVAVYVANKERELDIEHGDVFVELFEEPMRKALEVLEDE